MKQIKQPSDLLSIQDVAGYLSTLLKERSARPDEAVAAGIVGLETNDAIDDWREKDADLDAIVSAAWDLEWSNGTPESLASAWQDIEHRVRRLEQRYLKDAIDSA